MNIPRIHKIFNNPYIPFYCVCIFALLAVYLLYDNQFNKRVEGSIEIRLPFRSVGDRGHIFFTDKNDADHLVASTHFGYNLVISPLQLGDSKEIYEHLSEEIDLDQDIFFSKIQNDESQYEIIKRDLPESVRERIEKRISDYDLTGVWLESFKKREYIHGSLGSHVIGFVSVDDNDTTLGQYGIENTFNDVLTASNKTAQSPGDTLLEQLNELPPRGSDRAGNVFLTIDINVQKEIETQLRNVKQKWGAKKVGGIVMNPHDGSVIAMGAVPTFDPNNFSKVADYRVFNNPNVQDVYEMGSVFKALTVAIGLDSGRVSRNDTYTDHGSLTIDNRTISNYDGVGRGKNIPIQTILSQSLNTGAVFLLQKTTIGVYKDYLDRFRFNDVTRIDLPKEIPGLVDNLETGQEIEFATASYGHGIAITPIAAAKAFSSLANGGFIVEPHVLSRVEQPRKGGLISGTLTKNTRERKRIFREKITDQVTEYLIRVYDYAMLGGLLRNPQYSIAAKTGTAQLVDPATGEYAEGKFLHSFFGYFPARDPQYIIFLFAVDPKAKFASETLARPFSDLTDFLIAYYAIPPDR